MVRKKVLAFSNEMMGADMRGNDWKDYSMVKASFMQEMVKSEREFGMRVRGLAGYNNKMEIEELEVDFPNANVWFGKIGNLHGFWFNYYGIPKLSIGPH